MRVKVRNIACAAWMRWRGLPLLDVTARGEFEFESDESGKSAADWLREYQETDFYRVDAQLLALRDLLAQARQ